jgi:LPS O-antigen subunit length determinant protein (WzzB/FepE family)
MGGADSPMMGRAAGGMGETPFMQQFAQHKEMLAQRVEQANPQVAQMIRSAQDEQQLADMIAQLQGSPAGPQAGAAGLGGMSGRVPGY